MRRILLTGGVGFIGSHTVEHIMKNTDYEVVIIDRLTYAGNQNFLTDMEKWGEFKKRIKFVYHDFRSPISDVTSAMIGDITDIIHMGAESHVDRSLLEPVLFEQSNVLGTINMMEFGKERGVNKFIYVSTDEVYGAAMDGKLHKEGEPHRPSNPYSASKSGAEAFCYAYWKAYDFPVIVTNTMNNFGERQNVEKFVPKTVNSILSLKPVTVHCKKVDDKIVDISSRCWLHARNHADALLFLLDKGQPGEHYNVVGELKNVVEMAEMIGDYLQIKPNLDYVDFHSFRKGHDMHYGLDGTKLLNMGWKPPVPFEESLKKTVFWMKNRQDQFIYDNWVDPYNPNKFMREHRKEA
jgi:dTDP-glucose 4,6-dehydratase